MAFPTGTLRIAPPPSDGAESGLHRFILGQIFTGRAYPKDDPNQKNVVPEGYDSLYLFDSQSLEDDQLLDSYSHEYILTRPSQVWPQYVVHFTIASLTDEDRARQGRAKAAHHNQNTDVMGDILELLDRKLHWGQDGVRMKLSGVAALQNEGSRATGIEMSELFKLIEYWESVRFSYAAFESGQKSGSAEVGRSHRRQNAS